jgi:protein TonB
MIDPMPFLGTSIPSTQMDDLVFEHRNKIYGAYQIRRRYSRNMVSGILGAILFILLILFYEDILSVFKRDDPFKLEDLHQTEYIVPDYIPGPPPGKTAAKKEVEKKAKPVSQKREQKPRPALSQNPVSSKNEEKPPTTEKDTGSEKSSEDGGMGKGTEGEGTGGDEIYRMVSRMPLFPGCEEAAMGYSELKKCSEKRLREFLRYNLKYPAQAVRNKTEGTVLIQFIVERDGRVSNIKILQDIGDGCGQEARRVVEMMNNMTRRWTPGLQNGQLPVRVQYTLPVVFSGREAE